MHEGTEILVKARSVYNSDPIKDQRGCYKRGDIVAVRPRGFNWGREERNSSKFQIITIKDIDPDQFLLYSADALGCVAQENHCSLGFRRRVGFDLDLAPRLELTSWREVRPWLRDKQTNHVALPLSPIRFAGVSALLTAGISHRTGELRRVSRRTALRATLASVGLLLVPRHLRGAPGAGTFTIKSTGGDYTNLFNAEAGQQADLTGTGACNLECYSSAAPDTTLVTVDGWTTTASDYIKIYTPSSERHDGKWNASKYRLSSSATGGDALLNIKEDYVKLYGLQFERSSDTNYAGCVIVSEATFGSSAIIFAYCICQKHSGSTYVGYGLFNSAYYGNVSIYNSVFNGVSEIAANPAIQPNGGAEKTYVYNCTIASAQKGIAASPTSVVTNCLFTSCTVDGSGTLNDTYCATTNDNTKGLNASGTGNRFSQTFGFVNGGSGDFHLQVSDGGAKDHGVSDPGTGLFSDDIDGATRSGSWDIGADEYTAGAPSSRPKAIIISNLGNVFSRRAL